MQTIKNCKIAWHCTIFKQIVVILNIITQQYLNYPIQILQLKIFSWISIQNSIVKENTVIETNVIWYNKTSVIKWNWNMVILKFLIYIDWLIGV
jgi:hypothetical protein